MREREGGGEGEGGRGVLIFKVLCSLSVFGVCSSRVKIDEIIIPLILLLLLVYLVGWCRSRRFTCRRTRLQDLAQTLSRAPPHHDGQQASDQSCRQLRSWRFCHY